jgi:hypothetical protein
MEDDGIFNGNLVYFKAISYRYRPFGIFYGHLVPFYSLVCLYQENLATLIKWFPYGYFE